MDEYLTDAIRNYHDDREDRSMTIAILSIAQSIDRIATAQERIATAQERLANMEADRMVSEGIYPVKLEG